VSSLAAAPSPAGARGQRAAVVGRRLAGSPALASFAVAALLLAVVFVARGGSALSRTTTVTIGMTLAGAAAVAGAILAGAPRRRLWGGVTVLLMAALAGVTGASVAWSIEPSDSWQAANLTLGYLAVFAGAAAIAHVAPRRWPALLGGVVIAAVVASGYALVAKVFPSISPLDLYARLRAPFDYWNAVGLMAALGIPGCLWLGARRDGHAALNALAIPALGLLLTALLLSYGRGPLLAALVATVCWFAIAPLRLRAVAVLGTALAGATIVCVWAFSNDALATDGTPLDVRADAGHALGLLLVALVVVLTIAGLALSFAMSRSALSAALRRQIGTVVLTVVVMIPLGGIAGLAVSERGLTGSISHGWHQLTDPSSEQPPNDPSRLASVGGVRARYWDDAFKIWDAATWIGVGADGYATARRPLQNDRLRVRHAHGYVPQTLADLGLLGLGTSIALLIAWLVAAARAAGIPSRRGTDQEVVARIGAATLATTAIAFGVHSAIDWTWFVPGTAVVAVACAGWVAGAGPPGERLGSTGQRRSAARAAAALAAIVVGLAAAWTVWQPQRAVSADDDALVALDAGRLDAARADAERAHRIDPLSIEPLLTLAAVQAAAQQPDAARATLQRAVRLQPANPESWLRLGELELAQGRPRAALAVLNAAIYLDPQGVAAQSVYEQARQAVAAGR
jgi:hypothetical protein